MAALMATSKKAYAKEHLPGLLLPVLPPHSEPLLTHASRGDPPTLAGRSHSFFSGVTAPFPWVLVHTRFCLCPPSVEFLWSPVLRKSCNQILQEFKFRVPGNSHSHHVPFFFRILDPRDNCSPKHFSCPLRFRFWKWYYPISSAGPQGRNESHRTLVPGMVWKKYQVT